MKKLLLAALCAFPLFAGAQVLLFNDGATITIDPNALLVVEGGVTNTSTGTINNDGTLEIQGNFLNQGNYDNAQANTLRFSGTGNSTVTPGTGQFHKVELTKANANVILAGDLIVTNNLDFNSASAAKIETGNFKVILNAATTVLGADANEYVVTSGTGSVQKNMTASGTFAFPVGDATNYSPLSSTWTGSAYSSANLKVRVNNVVHPNKPSDATDFITRYWDVDAAGITGYANTLVGTYINTAEDVTGTASLIKGATYAGGNWSYADAAAGTGTVTGSTTNAAADFTGTNFFGKVNLIAFLQGPYSTSTGLMSTTLNTNNLIPLASPYADAPATAASIPAAVTDWVKLELRDVANPTLVLGKASAFIKNDGTIVDLDGTSLPRIKNGNPTSVVAIFHRNHLPIRTPNTGLDVINPTLYNFSTNLAQAFDSPGITTNDAMINIGNTGVWGLFRGNANGDNNINAVDLAQVKLNSNPSQSNVYLKFDVNLDSNVNAVDLAQTKSASNPSKAAHINN